MCERCEDCRLGRFGDCYKIIYHLEKYEIKK